MSGKEENPCDKCPWKTKETCESCELKGEARATREIRRIRLETNQN